ncbi:hypothetical protein SNEBB_009569 [Seison nebaliae]|nr:hypothetical protein SNEBB_009569 [Seison nebaliae]
MSKQKFDKKDMRSRNIDYVNNRNGSGDFNLNFSNDCGYNGIHMKNIENEDWELAATTTNPSTYSDDSHEFDPIKKMVGLRKTYSKSNRIKSSTTLRTYRIPQKLENDNIIRSRPSPSDNSHTLSLSPHSNISNLEIAQIESKSFHKSLQSITHYQNIGNELAETVQLNHKTTFISFKKITTLSLNRLVTGIRNISSRNLIRTKSKQMKYKRTSEIILPLECTCSMRRKVINSKYQVKKSKQESIRRLSSVESFETVNEKKHSSTNTDKSVGSTAKPTKFTKLSNLKARVGRSFTLLKKPLKEPNNDPKKPKIWKTIRNNLRTFGTKKIAKENNKTEPPTKPAELNRIVKNLKEADRSNSNSIKQKTNCTTSHRENWIKSPLRKLTLSK